MSNVKGVSERNWILTLFIRDDGERFLLGDGSYEFKESQKHFAASSIVNDDVEVQGADGVLLAGQVRRPATQEFDGYIGTATATKEEIEFKRRDFLGFFLARHTFTAIYVFTNGKAIQRRRGYLVDAPEVKELFQIHPEYHVALNFEDVNYYAYSEDADGNEIFANLYKLINTRATSGGLVWDEIGVVWDDVTAGGKNLLDPSNGWTNQIVMVDGNLTNNANTALSGYIPVVAGQSYTFSQTQLTNANYLPNIVSFFDGAKNFIGRVQVINLRPHTFTAPAGCAFIRFGYYNANGLDASNLWNLITDAQLEQGAVVTDFEPFIPAGGAVWEEGSDASANLIEVDSLDEIYPIITIIGRADNIVLENASTGDKLEYIGAVAAGQTLVIDTQNQTAKLNGVNVLGNLTGDWLRLKPGQNRILYDANTDDVSEAILEWQEIVG